MGPRLGGEARTVHALFMERWDFEDEDNPHAPEAMDAERRRQLWRLYRRDNAAFPTLRAQSGFNVQPPEPDEAEPRDMERFFAELEARFRTSSSENLSAIQSFAPLVNETAERMFARFNVIAKPLEDERPRVMTREQLKTTYLVHLRTILSIANALVVDRDIRESERDRADHGLEPLSCHEIHGLVLRQEREVAIEETKLRAVGLSHSQGSERTN